jgi:hypothetical protein
MSLDTKSPFLGVASRLLAVLAGGWWSDAAAVANPVMSWIPAYQIQESADALQKRLGGARTAAQTISGIALQFWTPVEGALTLDKRD